MRDEKSKLTRWSRFLSRLSFIVEHCAGKNNELADALSRHPAPDAPTPGEPDLDCMLPPRRNYGPSPSTATHPVINAIRVLNDVRDAQHLDTMVNREIECWHELRDHSRRTTCRHLCVGNRSTKSNGPIPPIGNWKGLLIGCHPPVYAMGQRISHRIFKSTDHDSHS